MGDFWRAEGGLTRCAMKGRDERSDCRGQNRGIRWAPASHHEARTGKRCGWKRRKINFRRSSASSDEKLRVWMTPGRGSGSAIGSPTSEKIRKSHFSNLTVPEFPVDEKIPTQAKPGLEWATSHRPGDQGQPPVHLLRGNLEDDSSTEGAAVCGCAVQISR